MRAWRLSELGDPWDVLSLQEVESPSPGIGEARVQVSASDLNFADILQCQGQYQVRLDPPFTPGMSVAGTVVEVGSDCELEVGDRVLGMTASGWGGYAEEALVRGHEMRIVPSDVLLQRAQRLRDRSRQGAVTELPAEAMNNRPTAPPATPAPRPEPPPPPARSFPLRPPETPPLIDLPR